MKRRSSVDKPLCLKQFYKLSKLKCLPLFVFYKTNSENKIIHREPLPLQFLETAAKYEL